MAVNRLTLAKSLLFKVACKLRKSEKKVPRAVQSCGSCRSQAHVGNSVEVQCNEQPNRLYNGKGISRGSIDKCVDYFYNGLTNGKSTQCVEGRALGEIMLCKRRFLYLCMGGDAVSPQNPVVRRLPIATSNCSSPKSKLVRIVLVAI